MKKKVLRSILAVVTAMTILGSYIVSYAASMPNKASAPTRQDVWDLMDYMNDEFYYPLNNRQISLVDNVASELEYYKSGTRVGSLPTEVDYDSLNRQIDQLVQGEDPTALLTDTALYEQWYDKAVELIGSLQTATGAKYIEDIEPVYEELLKKCGQIANLDQAGKIIWLAAGDPEPDVAQMAAGTYWAYESDLQAFFDEMQAVDNIAIAWSWTGHDGGPDILRTEMENVNNRLQAAYNSIVSKLHGGAKLETINITATPTYESVVEVEGVAHVHNYVWEVIMDPTINQDGEMQYRCSCGDVKEKYKIPASEVYIKGLYGAVKEAAVNGTVNYDSSRWFTISDYILNKMSERSDVTVNVKFEYKGVKYQITFPAGTDYTKVLTDEPAMYGYFGVAAELGLTVTEL